MKDERVRFVAGNTGTGIYKDEGHFDVLIDIKEIDELKMLEV